MLPRQQGLYDPINEKDACGVGLLANINGIKVRQGETLLVPASENVLYIFGNATFLTAHIK